MMRIRAWAVVVVVTSMLTGGTAVRAFADINNASGTNVQSGDNRGNTHEGGSSTSGAANGGQITGVVASGRTSVDARNTSSNSTVESGDAHASNSSNSVVGLTHSNGGPVLVGSTTDLSFIDLGSHGNLQDGDNRQTSTQTANATTGDGVAGEVIGVVTAAGGSASVVAANTSNNVDVTTGDAHADNVSDAFVGLVNVAGDGEFGVGPSDISNVTAHGDSNIQDGNNRQTLDQAANSTTGDGVAGQVVGVVAAGATSVDASNTSDNVDVTTGDAHSANGAGAAVGLAFTEGSDVEINPADINNVHGTDHLNVQDGNNAQTARQSATSATGDGVAGEVIGAVTSAGGSASIVAANTSRDSDVTTGDAHTSNASAAFVGDVTNNNEIEIGVGDVSGVSTGSVSNVQDGNNRQTLNQTSNATTGDGVAGQVIGAVSAGATSIDARNTSDNVDVTTGDAHSTNESHAYVGLASSRGDDIEVGASASDVSNVNIDSYANIQDGNNRQTLTQSASSATGDGVAGEVIGAVTSAGGSASIVAANSSTNSDVTTGDARSDNYSAAFVGQALSDDGAVRVSDVSNISLDEDSNVQDGDNAQTARQSASASSGDGVAGQVIGAVSAGATSIDARNTSDNVSVESGDARSSNSSRSFVGLAFADGGNVEVGPSDVTNVNLGDEDANIQDGSNRQTLTQSSGATTGDAVGGEVIGAVTSAGGSASIVAANTSTNSDVTTGDARSTNDSAAIVGQAFSEDDNVQVGLTDVASVTVDEANVQDGDNRQTLTQTASATSGDGIAGQVIGVVSAGATSVDASNTSDNVDATSGDARSSNDSNAFVGLAWSDENIAIAPADVSSIDAGAEANIQDGSNRQTFTQSASATSGDAVAGQVMAGVTAGIITGAGGSVSVVVANTSSNLDSTTGDARFSNDNSAFVGLGFAFGDALVGS
jgi:hypothetical protein